MTYSEIGAKVLRKLLRCRTAKNMWRLGIGQVRIGIRRFGVRHRFVTFDKTVSDPKNGV